jgi:hypothetical protein
MGKALTENIRLIEEAENRGKRFCPSCGSRMKTCCELHRQLNLLNHRVNCVHDGPEQWICLNCGLIEYKDLAMRMAHGRAGAL